MKRFFLLVFFAFLNFFAAADGICSVDEQCIIGQDLNNVEPGSRLYELILENDMPAKYISMRIRQMKKLMEYLPALNKDLPSELRPQSNRIIFWLQNLKNKIQNKCCTEPYCENCIWTLWLQGKDQAPGIIQNCWRSIEKYSNGRRVIILTEKDIHNYIRLPEYIWEKYRKKIIPSAHFADIVRYCLLYKYGGTWIDASVLLTGNIPDFICKQELFMFSMAKGTRMRNFFLTANWFIHAHKGNIIMGDLIKLNLDYWKKENELLSYWLNYFFFTIAVRNSKEAENVFNKMPYYPEILPLYPSLIKPYDENKLKLLLKDDFFPIHKLTYNKKGRKNIPENSLFKHLSKENLSLL